MSSPSSSSLPSPSALPASQDSELQQDTPNASSFSAPSQSRVGSENDDERILQNPFERLDQLKLLEQFTEDERVASDFNAGQLNSNTFSDRFLFLFPPTTSFPVELNTSILRST